MPPVKRERRGYHHGHLRETLVDTALELMAEGGPRGFSMAEASRRAKVSISAPYRHFADRDQLLAAVGERGYSELGQRLAHAVMDVQRPADQIVAVSSAYVQFAAEESAMFAALFGLGLEKARYPDLLAASVQAFEPLMSAARALVRDDAVAIDLAIAVTALAHGHATLLVDGHFSVTGDDAASVSRRTAAATAALVRSRSLLQDRAGAA